MAPIDVPTSHTPWEHVTVDLFRYMGGLWRRKWIIASSSIGMAVLACALSYTRPKLFEASVKFMPPTRTVQTLMISLSRTPGDEYRAMLNSDSVAFDVVKHQHLMEYFKVQDPELARRILGGSAKFSIDTNNFVTITVTSKDPAYCLRVANEYYDSLFRLTERLAGKEAEHRLDFMSGPLNVERQRLAAAEDALRDAQQKTGLVLPEAQGALGVQQVASLRTQISSLEEQLATARLGATDENPRVVTLLSRIDTLQGQVDALEGKSSQVNSPARLPQLSLEVTRRARAVQSLTLELESLTRALDLSRTQDSYVPSLSLIDGARLPKTKVSPKRAIWSIVGFVLGFVLSVLWAFFATALHNWKRNADAQRRREALRRAWRGEQPDPGHGI